MKTKNSIFLTIFLSILVALSPFAGVKAGSLYSDPVNISQSGNATGGKIALLADGRPCVTFSTTNKTQNQRRVYLKCQNQDGSWSGLINKTGPDQLSDAKHVAFAPQIIVDNQNRPIVAWIQRVEPINIFVNQQLMTNSRGKRGPSLSKYNVRVVRFNGTSWRGPVKKGASDSVTVGVNIQGRPNLLPNSYSLALNPATNEPAIAWQNDKTGDVYFRESNGTSWTGRLGGVDNVSADGVTHQSATPSLAYRLSGQPMISWSDLDVYFGKTTILLKTFTGTSWRGFGSRLYEIVSHGHDSAVSPSLIVQKNRPVVAWVSHKTPSSREEVYVRAFNGTYWWGLDGASTQDLVSGNLIETRSPSLSVNPAGRVGVAFSATTDSTKPHQIYYTSFGNGQWQGLGGTAYDQVSLVGSAQDAALALSDLGKPYLIWLGTTNNTGVFYSYGY